MPFCRTKGGKERHSFWNVSYALTLVACTVDYGWQLLNVLRILSDVTEYLNQK